MGIGNVALRIVKPLGKVAKKHVVRELSKAYTKPVSADTFVKSTGQLRKYCEGIIAKELADPNRVVISLTRGPLRKV